MNRQQQLNNEVREITKKVTRYTSAEPKMLYAEYCHNLKDIMFVYGWIKFKIASGLEKDFILKSGKKICKKKEATNLLIVGEQNENGCFIIGKTKRYWLKSI